MPIVLLDVSSIFFMTPEMEEGNEARVDSPSCGIVVWEAASDTHHQQEDGSDANARKHDLSAAHTCHEEEGIYAADHTKRDADFDHHGDFRR